MFKQINNILSIILTIIIIKYQLLVKYGKLLILEELSTNLEEKQLEAIVLHQMVMPQHNIIVNLFMIQTNQD